MLTGDRAMKVTALMDLIFVGLVVLLFTFFNNEAVFIFACSEIESYPSERDGYTRYYIEHFLIDMYHVPKDKKILKRPMIYNYLRVGSSMESLQKYSTDLRAATTEFLKNTPATRGYYIYGRIHDYGRHGVKDHKTDIGFIITYRCKDDTAKRFVLMALHKGTANIHEYRSRIPGYDMDTLQNDCDPAWYEANKDNDLVKYYMELRNK